MQISEDDINIQSNTKDVSIMMTIADGCVATVSFKRLARRLPLDTAALLTEALSVEIIGKS